MSKIKILEPGHVYELKNMEQMYEGIDSYQQLNFIWKEQKTPDSKEMELIKNGTTNEAVLEMLIDRMEWLDGRFPSDYNKKVIDLLKQSVVALEERTADRVNRGVEGQFIA